MTTDDPYIRPDCLRECDTWDAYMTHHVEDHGAGTGRG